METENKYLTIIKELQEEVEELKSTHRSAYCSVCKERFSWLEGKDNEIIRVLHQLRNGNILMRTKQIFAFHKECWNKISEETFNI